MHGFRKLRTVTEKEYDMKYAFLNLATAMICWRLLGDSLCLVALSRRLREAPFDLLEGIVTLQLPGNQT